MLEEMNYPNNIAMVRRMRGLSQAYIAREIGVSRPKYIDIEKGKKELTVSQLQKLKKILDVDFNDLIGVDTGRINLRDFIHKHTKPQNTGNELLDNTPSQKISSLKLFEDKTVRSIWDNKEEKWWFVVVDVVRILTDSKNPKEYIKKVKKRDPELNKGWGQIVPLLLMDTAGGKQKVGCADARGILRIIQSIPSKKAEPFKSWLAKVGSERIDQMVDPEKSIEQALVDYKRLGYSDNWINQRLKSIEIRKDLTNEWDKHGIKRGQEYAALTDIIYQTWAGKTTKEYKEYKSLKKENLRDNMTNEELVMNMLAELSTTSITKTRNPQTLADNANCAVAGGNVAKVAKEKLEAETGRKVVSKLSVKNSKKLQAKAD